MVRFRFGMRSNESCSRHWFSALALKYSTGLGSALEFALAHRVRVRVKIKIKVTVQVRISPRG